MSYGVAGYSIFVYGTKPLGASVHPEMKTVFEQNKIGIYSHIFASLFTLLLGPFQLSTYFRKKHIKWHRIGGMAYLLIGVLIGGVSGLYMALHAYGGMTSHFGFSLLSITWLFTGFMALYSIRKRDIENHRKWMIRNFSLSFGAVTLRIYLGLFFAFGYTFEQFYPLLAWLAWVPNLLFVEWLFCESKKPGKLHDN